MRAACHARTACHDDEAFGRQQTFLIINHSRKNHVRTLHIDASAHAVVNAAGLFEDFLQHEVRIASLLQLAEIERYRLYLVQAFHILQVNNPSASLPRADEGNLFVFQIHHLICVFHNRRGIRSQEKLSFTDAHHQRTALACSDYPHPDCPCRAPQWHTPQSLPARQVAPPSAGQYGLSPECIQ